ncbi:MAG: hypothetical protein JJ863_28520 [Deltaproteobacteria bacterium]|nr:hypothetical protein [Deltaproteobacteria bacterium]
MRTLGSGLLLLVLLAAATDLACVPEDVPGEVVGTYEFEGRLEVNECGSAAFPAVDTLEMRAELRRDLDMAVWRVPQAPITYGVVEDDDSYVFTGGGTYPAYEGCTFVQEEMIAIDGVGEESPTGETVIRISVAAGSDCTPSHTVAGGPFLALPCEIRWSMDGSAIDPIF